MDRDYWNQLGYFRGGRRTKARGQVLALFFLCYFSVFTGWRIGLGGRVWCVVVCVCFPRVGCASEECLLWAEMGVGKA